MADPLAGGSAVLTWTLWRLWSLTCGDSPGGAPRLQVREFHEHPTETATPRLGHSVFWQGPIWTAGREEDAEPAQIAGDDLRISRRSAPVVPPHMPTSSLRPLPYRSTPCGRDSRGKTPSPSRTCRRPGRERTTPYLHRGKPLDVATPAAL